MQKEVAAAADMQASNYSKIESGQRDISVEALDRIARLFEMRVDGIIHFEDKKKRLSLLLLKMKQLPKKFN